MDSSKEFIRLHISYEDQCIARNNDTIIFLEADESLRKCICDIASTCVAPGITTYDVCTEETAKYVVRVLSSIDNNEVKIIYINRMKRKIIENTATIATPPQNVELYCTTNSTKSRYTDFYYKVLEL